jgi:two-component system, OmpR family, sensor histidine kinase BaeS
VIRDGGLGPLGRRLLAAFVTVALASVAVLSVIAIAGTVRGISAGEAADRTAAAESVAAAAASAYAVSGGWSGADLSAADDAAGAAGARLVVRDASGQVVLSPTSGTGQGMGPGMGMGQGMGAGTTGAVSAPVVVDGQQVGTVVLGFGSSSSTSAQQVAWTWILVAAGIALVVAFAAAWWVTRRFTRPLVRLAAVADEVASGSLSARPSAADLAEPGEIGELARAFATAAERVESSDAARTRMSADLAHELRTPLAALQAGLEELRDGLEEPDPERLEALHRQALRLGRVVGDLAELSAAESATLSLRHDRLDLAALVGDAVREAAPTTTAAGLLVSTRSSGPVPVVGDSDRLHQVVGNLLSNAARYCRAGDRVELATYVDDGTAVLEVADSGPGIPEADLPSVFDRLWRGSADSDPSGSGIGLAVVRELVTAHGGRVSAASDGASGTTVRVELPAAR